MKYACTQKQRFDTSAFALLTGMALVSGMATVIGGVSDDEFLRDIEVLDNSADDNSPSGMDWRVAAHALTRPR